VSDREARSRRGFLRSGGWILVAGLLLTVAALAWHVTVLLTHRRSGAVGDGRTVASYRFDLSNLEVPPELVAASGAVKDGVVALVDPEVWTLVDLEAARKERRRRGKVLVGRDRVVGVEHGGERRAYPLRFLVWHEVVNDTLGGEPIAVSYSPLSDGAAVFRRSIGGETVAFGVSGLLYNSNLLLYDRRRGGAGESLWAQLPARAVAGPAAAGGQTLAPVPAELTTWGDWLARHPDTTLLAPLETMVADYKREPYGSYFGSDLLRFPVAPLPPPEEAPLKTPVVAVATAEGFAAVRFPLPAPAGGGTRSWSAVVGGRPLVFTASTPPATITARTPAGAPAAAFHAAYFAWYAAHRDDTVWLQPPQGE
jgi:hypothetical protein